MQREHRAHARTMTSHRRHPTVRSDLITDTGCPAALNLSMNTAYKRNTVCWLAFTAGAGQTEMTCLEMNIYVLFT